MTQPNVDAIQQAERLLASARYQSQVKDAQAAISSCAAAIGKVCGLDENDRKILAYWAASTHIPPDRKTVNPPLTTRGDTGTGKSSSTDVMKDYCYEAAVFHAKNQSFATVRDKIIAELEEGAKTIVIEEADRCTQADWLEEFVFCSYSRDTARGNVNKLTAVPHGAVYKPNPYDLFVPLVCHRRKGYMDVANENRGIEVKFEPKKGQFADPDTVARDNTDKMRLAADLLLVEPNRPDGIEGRVWKNWRLLMSIANALGDNAWATWLTDRLKKDSLRMEDGRGFEPRAVIFLSTVAASERNSNGGYQPCPLSAIRDVARKEYGMYVHPRQIKAELRDLGVKITFPHGVNHATLTEDIVKQIADKLELDLKEIADA